MYNFVKLIRSILFAAVIALTLPSKTSAEEILVIDPGHGGIFSGTCGYSGKETGFCEKDANLLVALKLKEMVEAHSDITVHMTRSEDTDFIDDLSIPIWHNDALLNDMENRMVIANGFVKGKTATSIFISIHHNQDVASENTRGTETFYYDGVNNNNPRFPPHPNQLKYLENNKRLGEITHNNLLEALGLRDRELRNDQSFFVLRNAEMPAILVEIGFLTNPEEEALIQSEEFQQDAAKALAKSVFTYFDAIDAIDSLKGQLNTSIADEEGMSASIISNVIDGKDPFDPLLRKNSKLSPYQINRLGICTSIAAKRFFGITHWKLLTFQLRIQNEDKIHSTCV